MLRAWVPQLPVGLPGSALTIALYNPNVTLTEQVRDGLWFLTDDDARCEARFDPHESGCDRMCTPVKSCSPGEACDYIPIASCSSLRVGSGSKQWHQTAKDRCTLRSAV